MSEQHNVDQSTEMEVKMTLEEYRKRFMKNAQEEAKRNSEQQNDWDDVDAFTEKTVSVFEDSLLNK